MSWEMGWPLGLEGPLHHPAPHRPAASYVAAERLEDEGGEGQVEDGRDRQGPGHARAPVALTLNMVEITAGF